MSPTPPASSDAPAPEVAQRRVAVDNISESRLIEEAQRFLLESYRLRQAEDFFRSLARYLAESLGVDYVCIDRLEGDQLRARTVAIFNDGAFENDVEYTLKDTPCGEVVGKTICIFEAGVRHRFPRDAVLQELGAESYAGATLWGFDGRPIGLIAIIGRRPLTNPRPAEILLKLVALRAAGELERRQAEEAVRESEERYRAIVESSRELIFFLDPGGRIRWQNSTFRELIGAVSEDDEFIPRVHPGDALRVADAWRSAQGGEGKVSCRVQTVDGGYRNLESTFRKIAIAGEMLWCVVSTDTTELTKLRRKVAGQEGISGIVGRDRKILQISASITDLAEVDAPVLILGESGTGKELVATAIHREGPRAGKNFIAINCGAIPDTLLETELFGHVKGSFTGAIRDKKGRFELADGGTIFFDEVGDLSLAMQVKLLRVLQQGTFEKVGAEKPCRVDVRLISATNKDLKQEIAAKRFREDLFYRISVVPLTIPPLRERLTDIPLLAEHLVDEETHRVERRHDPTRPPLKVTIAGETLALLLAHSWPGNVRELQNVLRFALIKCKGNLIRPEHLPSAFTMTERRSLSIKGRKPKLTADLAASALEQAGGHPGEAARSLGVSRTTLYRHLSKIR